MKNISCFTAILLFFIFGCSSPHNRSPWDIHDFKSVSGEVFLPDLFLGVPYGLLIADHKLFVLDRYDGKECTVIDLNSNSQISRVFPIGDGPEEVHPPLFLSYDYPKNQLELYERSGSRLSHASINPPDSGLISIHDRTSFKGFFSRVFMLNPNVYVGSGVFDNGPLCLFNQEGIHLREFGEYPMKEKVQIKRSMLLSAQGELMINPNRDRVVLAGLYSDQLLFYKINDTIPVKVKEYFSFEAELNVFENENSDHIEQNEKTFIYYLNAYPTESQVYLLYWGAKHKDAKEMKLSECYLLSFDWNGIFKKGYIIPSLLVNIAIDEQNNVLYGITSSFFGDRKLMRFEL